MILSALKLDEVSLERKLDSFDLNGDGEFSAAEQTPEMRTAMKEFANDTGSNLAPLVYLIFCPLYSAAAHALLGVIGFGLRKSYQLIGVSREGAKTRRN